MNNARQTLTIKQVVESPQVPADTVYRLAASGEFQARKIGRIRRFPKDTIQDFLQSESRQRRASSVPGGDEPGTSGSGACRSAAERGCEE